MKKRNSDNYFNTDFIKNIVNSNIVKLNTANHAKYKKYRSNSVIKLSPRYKLNKDKRNSIINKLKKEKEDEEKEKRRTKDGFGDWYINNEKMVEKNNTNNDKEMKKSHLVDIKNLLSDIKNDNSNENITIIKLKKTIDKLQLVYQESEEINEKLQEENEKLKKDVECIEKDMFEKIKNLTVKNVESEKLLDTKDIFISNLNDEIQKLEEENRKYSKSMKFIRNVWYDYKQSVNILEKNMLNVDTLMDSVSKMYNDVMDRLNQPKFVPKKHSVNIDDDGSSSSDEEEEKYFRRLVKLENITEDEEYWKDYPYDDKKEYIELCNLDLSEDSDSGVYY